MYLDTHKPPLVTVGAGNMLQDAVAAQALPFVNAATNRPATKEEIAHAFRVVASMPGGLPAERYHLSPSIELPEETVKELAISRVRTEFVPKIKKLFRGFDGFPVAAREAIIDIAYNAGVGSPETVVHGKTHAATGLHKFHRLKTAIEAGDWLAAARSSHRSSSRPERNEWTRELFERAAREDGTSHRLHLLDKHLKPPVF
jgi:GH24 family phage-related lysozyme (muramidase)